MANFKNDMEKKKNRELSRIIKKEDELYNAYGSHCGFSSSENWILCYIYEADDTYTQNDLTKLIFSSKQTINSAISRLINKGYIKLEHIDSTRNSKSIKLTKKGENICKIIIAPLIKAEESALSKMTKKEVDDLIELSNKRYKFLKEEIDKLCDTKIKT